MSRAEIIFLTANFSQRIDFGQSAQNPFGVSMLQEKPREAPMAIQSNHDDPWIHGNPEERTMILAVMIMIAMSPFVLWWFHG